VSLAAWRGGVATIDRLLSGKGEPNAVRRRFACFLGGEDQCGQATKGVWGMSWRQEAKKGVEDCDKPGGLVKRELIPGSLNQRIVNP
jgi:hypothetical protein